MIQKIKDYFNNPQQIPQIELQQDIKYIEIKTPYTLYYYKATVKIILKDTKAVLQEEFFDLGRRDNSPENLFTNYLDSKKYGQFFRFQNTYHHIDNIHLIELTNIQLDKTTNEFDITIIKES